MSGNLTAFSQSVSKAGLMGFSGTDIKAVIRLPAYKKGHKRFNSEGIFQLGTLQTISISTYNSKTPVKSLGFKAPLAIARGSRTIAGTMIFNQLNTHVFDDESVPLTVTPDKNGLLSYSSGESSYITSSNGPTSIDREKLKKQWDFSWDNTLIGEISKPADIPPFDIIIVMVNEAGNMAKIILYGVEIVHDSQTLSIEDIYTEAQYQYIARDIEYFRAKDINEAYAWSSSRPPVSPSPSSPSFELTKPSLTYSGFFENSYGPPLPSSEPPPGSFDQETFDFNTIIRSILQNTNSSLLIR